MLRSAEQEGIAFMEGLRGQLLHTEASLDDSQQVFVYCWHGHEKLRVLGFSMSSDNVVSMKCESVDGSDVIVSGHMHSVSVSIVVRELEESAVRRVIGFELPSPEWDKLPR